MKILEIGSGVKPKKFHEKAEVIHIDKFKTEFTDVVWDVEKVPLPFKNNYFAKVYSNNVFEHVQNFVPLIEDIHRILKPNGTLQFRALWHKNTEAFFDDPTHVRAFTKKTMDYFDPSRFAGKYGGYISKAKFDIQTVQVIPEWKNINEAGQKLKSIALRKLFYIIMSPAPTQIEFVMNAIK